MRIVQNFEPYQSALLFQVKAWIAMDLALQKHIINFPKLVSVRGTTIMIDCSGFDEYYRHKRLGAGIIPWTKGFSGWLKPRLRLFTLQIGWHGSAYSVVGRHGDLRHEEFLSIESSAANEPLALLSFKAD
ncbi:hypothetical protein C7T94_09020 [Pedobacter yulinensis]|uniref:Uncharacterized protein n=1 Tax=Pedobacter yulinensis TaxID=2126353 RepID=A0A2T3HK07_9SPHI|nr:hypothetical protein [Pedobacter yulinensis]PST82777.1 hypothetical protein C7T94_09020 [Pedobacter yulinensis]